MIAPTFQEAEATHSAPRVFIANFGRSNYEWPTCLERSTVATMNAVGAHRFWEANDREGYIEYCRRSVKTALGEAPTRPVASRWFNLMTIISETSGDLWIHRERDRIWWTISLDGPAEITRDRDPTLKGDQSVYVCHKPCLPWSNQDRKGRPLTWQGLHPRAREFLFTEGTLQQLSPDNADYARALLDGADLSAWHVRAEWKDKLKAAKTQPVASFSTVQRSAWRMMDSAFATSKASNGQEVTRTIKNKEIRFSRDDLMAFLVALYTEQEGMCALTGLRLGLDGEGGDPQMLCSLDRIDSDGHYERGNLQIVCRFANRWKGADDNDLFLRLIEAIRSGEDVAARA